jgi:hypothetical protein
MTQPQVYALLVGIDRYKNPREAPHLRGCVADAESMRSLLINRLGVPEQNIRLLTARMDASEPPDRLATRDNIIKGWQEHLGQAKAGDQVFFHYSGHGAQARSNDPTELDGFDETIVPHDSRTSGVYDILDKELGALISQAEGRGAIVTVVLDCCHSGSGTRAASEPDENRPRVRRCKADDRQRPPSTIIPAPSQATTRALKKPSGWKLPEGGHVLLAGCRDEELSYEYRDVSTQQWHGATTYFLVKALNGYHSGMTWSEVHDVVYTNVHAIYPQQSPQLEGPDNRQILGGLAAPSTTYVLVTDVDRSPDGLFVKVSGGAAIGLSPGSQIAVYPPGSDMSGEPLATGSVTESKIDHAWAKLEEPLPPDTTIEGGCRVKITALGYEDLTYSVAVDDQDVRQAINTVAQGGPSPFLTIVPGDEPGAVFRVAVRHGRYAILDSDGGQLITKTPPASVEGAKEVAKNLQHLAVYRNVQRLRNPAPIPLLDGAVSIEAVSYTKIGRNGRPYDPMPLREPGHEAVLPPGRKLHITVRNNTNETLYISVFNLSANFGIFRLYPEMAPYATVAGGKEIQLFDLEPEIANPYLSRSTEIIKVFATRQPIEFDVLQMPELNEPEPPTRTRAGGILGELLNAVRHDGSKTRRLVVRRDNTHNQWITEQIEITVLNSHQTRRLVAGETTVELGTPLDITLDKPAAFEGQLIMSTVTQASRGTDVSAPLAPPPGLESPEAQAIFQPLAASAGGRALGADPAVLAITADSRQLAHVSEETPIHLELSVPDEPDLAGILPIAFDGEFYHLVGQQAEGRSRAVTPPGIRRLGVDIMHLPTPVDAGEGSEEAEEAVESRDLKRMVRLFLYKVFHRELPPDTGVRKAHVNEHGEVVYEPVTKDEVKQAQRVALLVHGFTSSTEWLVSKGWPHFHELGNYDLCLTYDYETFNTPIRENGKILSQTLQFLGFGENDDIHLDIFCHSMGTQVVRAAVELAGGHKFVDRVFMAGAPNNGTALAKGKDLFVWSGTILLNQGGLAPPALIASWFLKKIGDAGTGVDDLAPDSQFFQELNNESEPLDVPYFVQIGTTQIADAPLDWRRLFSTAGLIKVADIGLDVVLGGQNDLLVGVASARAVRHGHWPKLEVAELSGHHFQYFHTEESLVKLGQWLREG